MTDLSALGAGNFVPAVTPAATRALTSASTPQQAATASETDSSAEETKRFLLESPRTTVHVGISTATPGTQSLLNDKAAQFPTFARNLLQHVYVIAQHLEGGDVISRLKLPDNTQPVILVALMTKQGKLTELIVEQHSGEAWVDKIVIQACKQGLWAQNPPAGALSSDGIYRIRVIGRITNYASHDGIWTFRTDLGLAIL